MSAGNVGAWVQAVRRDITIVFKLDEPLVLVEGKWINRPDRRTGKRGYYLPFSIHTIEVHGALARDDRPRFYASAYGHTVTKEGRKGGEHRHTFYSLDSLDRIPMPDEVRAAIDHGRMLATEPHGWPA